MGHDLFASLVIRHFYSPFDPSRFRGSVRECRLSLMFYGRSSLVTRLGSMSDLWGSNPGGLYAIAPGNTSLIRWSSWWWEAVQDVRAVRLPRPAIPATPPGGTGTTLNAFTSGEKIKFHLLSLKYFCSGRGEMYQVWMLYSSFGGEDSLILLPIYVKCIQKCIRENIWPVCILQWLGLLFLALGCDKRFLLPIFVSAMPEGFVSSQTIENHIRSLYVRPQGQLVDEE